MKATQHSRRSQAFTLIELLAAVGVLMIIVTMVGVIFTESDRAWTLGTNRSDVNLAGRAALNMISHDLEYAIAYSNASPNYMIHFLARRDKYGLTSYGFPDDEMCFVSLQNNSADGNRAVREVFYYVRPMTLDPTRYELIRSYYDHQIEDDFMDHCYATTNWTDSVTDGGSAGRPTGRAAKFIARNVSGFSVFCYANGGETLSSYNSTRPAYSNRLPEYVDVCLELLPDRQAKQAARLDGTSLTNFVARNAMRYATRVYFHNRDGYKER